MAQRGTMTARNVVSGSELPLTPCLIDTRLVSDHDMSACIEEAPE
jgi:hypothetical protein